MAGMCLVRHREVWALVCLSMCLPGQSVMVTVRWRDGYFVGRSGAKEEL
uniref:Uncharacterized protein n=1 Tax=Picea glauca TaxID=3330 RepID=A0A117NGQ3_PICGL|nr:hypothetical protein ABT39_MTgene6158 [Picea glauca]QHR88785.1 hypothetical protein Q903MT_gene2800 [Picea sitchensis]